MKKPPSDWYRMIWSLDIENHSWTENTIRQVDFIISFLELSGNESILDLACGYGRHANEFARRGYTVTGVDITPQYIEKAKIDADLNGLKTTFICKDIRAIDFHNEFDVVLNIADGAVGYLENDQENNKIFNLIAKSLRKNGKHMMDICNAEYAKSHFPMRTWEIGKQSVSLPQFEWDEKEKRMLYGGWNIKFGSIAMPPKAIDAHSSIRLYTINEIQEIMNKIGMKVIEARTNYTNKKVTRNSLQMEIYSIKTI